jgi:hypothetical protein
MFGGFLVIIWGVEQGIALADKGDDLKTIKSLPPIIAAFSGIVTEFIGATFLFIYRSTMQQAKDYSRTLERINSVGMAMQILTTMPDKTEAGDLKSVTKAHLVELLVRGANDMKASDIERPKVPPRKRNTGKGKANTQGAETGAEMPKAPEIPPGAPPSA